MGKYIVTSGQNLFDVALHIYGSIEGIVDLMMNNLSLSLADRLKAGDTLVFTDDYLINPDIAAYYRINNITPANGERNVYYKSSVFPKTFQIKASNKQTSAGFKVSGSGKIEIDRGDNSPLLDLSGINVHREVLDEYLKSLVKKHYGRRNCTVTLTDCPSGEYREPGKDENGNYILSSGMEAVWVLCNEPAWNEGGYWKFIIDTQSYTSNPNS